MLAQSQPPWVSGRNSKATNARHTRLAYCYRSFPSITIAGGCSALAMAVRNTPVHQPLTRSSSSSIDSARPPSPQHPWTTLLMAPAIQDGRTTLLHVVPPVITGRPHGTQATKKKRRNKQKTRRCDEGSCVVATAGRGYQSTSMPAGVLSFSVGSMPGHTGSLSIRRAPSRCPKAPARSLSALQQCSKYCRISALMATRHVGGAFNQPQGPRLRIRDAMALRF